MKTTNYLALEDNAVNSAKILLSPAFVVQLFGFAIKQSLYGILALVIIKMVRYAFVGTMESIALAIAAFVIGTLWIHLHLLGVSLFIHKVVSLMRGNYFELTASDIKRDFAPVSKYIFTNAVSVAAAMSILITIAYFFDARLPFGSQGDSSIYSLCFKAIVSALFFYGLIRVIVICVNGMFEHTVNVYSQKSLILSYYQLPEFFSRSMLFCVPLCVSVDLLSEYAGSSLIGYVVNVVLISTWVVSMFTFYSGDELGRLSPSVE